MPRNARQASPSVCEPLPITIKELITPERKQSQIVQRAKALHCVETHDKTVRFDCLSEPGLEVPAIGDEHDIGLLIVDGYADSALQLR
jgi:hypothetical protein